MEDLRVIIGMMVMCNGIVIVIIEHDGRRPGLPNAPVVIAIPLNIQHNPYIFTYSRTPRTSRMPHSGHLLCRYRTFSAIPLLVRIYHTYLFRGNLGLKDRKMGYY